MHVTGNGPELGQKTQLDGITDWARTVVSPDWTVVAVSGRLIVVVVVNGE